MRMHATKQIGGRRERGVLRTRASKDADMRCVACLLIGLFAAAFALPQSAGAAGCPNFHVLHDDRIGPAVFPAGSYAVEPAAGSGLTCADASRLFTRFLEDWDGVLPRPWRVRAQTATFFKPANPTRSAFRVEPVGGASPR